MLQLRGLAVFAALLFTYPAAGQTSLNATPSSYSFSLHNGLPPPPPAVIPLVITSTGAPLTVSVSNRTDNGLGWINTTGGGPTPASIVVSINANLFMTAAGVVNYPAGTYQGTVVVSASGASNSPVSVPVTLTIDGASAISAALSVVPSSLAFTLQNGLALPPSTQPLSITASAGTLSVSASTGTDWLTVQGGGATPASVTVGLNASRFISDGVVRYPPGSYNGSVTITASGASNSPINVPVTLTVTGAIPLPQLGANLTSIAFNVQSGTAPSAQLRTLSITSGGGAVPFSISSSTSGGGGWLSVTPSGSGVTPASITVSLNSAAIVAGGVVSLAPATYQGMITIASTGASNTPIAIPVTLSVAAPPPQLTVAATPLSFAFQSGGAAPGSRTVSVSSTTPVSFTAAPQTPAPWLSVTPPSGTTPASLTVSVNTDGLGPGTYQNQIVVTAAGASGSPQIIPVTLAIGAPLPVIRGIVNAGSSLEGGVAPGEIVSIFGSALGPAAVVTMSVSGGVAGASLAGTRVLFDGNPAPLVFVSDSQVAAVAPYGLAGTSGTEVVVEAAGMKSQAVRTSVVDSSPAIFTADHSGTGPAAALNQDYSLNSASNPAAPGSVVMLYATGEGATTPAGSDGLITDAATLRSPKLSVSATIGGQPAAVLYAGSAPGIISGVMQLNVQVPAGLGHGSQPVIVKVGQGSSRAGVTIAVQ